MRFILPFLALVLSLASSIANAQTTSCAALKIAVQYGHNCTAAKPGAKCTVSCSANYILSGSAVARTCQKVGTTYQWASTTAFPKCTAIQCPALASLGTMYKHTCTKMNVGQRCTVSCNTGYAGSAVTRTCTKTGPRTAAWPSTPLPACTKPGWCPTLTLSATQSTIYTTTCKTAAPGAKCAIGCNTAKYYGTSITRTCVKSGTSAIWSPTTSYPKCTEITCPALSLGAEYTSNCGVGKIGTKCTISCAGGASGTPVTRTCAKATATAGTWGPAAAVPVCGSVSGAPRRFIAGEVGGYAADTFAASVMTGATGDAAIQSCAQTCYTQARTCLAISVDTSTGQCLMHQSRRGTTPLTAASTWQYFERESSASSNSDLWNEFASGNTARIADFSWAGYNQGRSDPPLVAENTAGWPVFPVNCGSSGYCHEGFQAAIDQASAAGGGIVKFPAGSFKFGAPFPSTTAQTNLIQTSKLIVRGAGSDCNSACTSLYLETGVGNLNYWYFRAASPKKTSGAPAKIVSAVRGTKTIVVDSNINRYLPESYVKIQAVFVNPSLIFGGKQLNPAWDASKQQTVHEPHKIQSVNAATNTITLYEPININVPQGGVAQLTIWTPINTVGFEDLQITSGWKTYPAVFSHHASDMIDYGWQAIQFNDVVNGWIRNVVFDSLSGIARFDTCYNTVAINNRLIGKQGHSGFLSLRGYGNLFRDNTDSIDIGQFHGPGVQSWDSTTVILRNVIATGARLESHSNIPQTTLLDGIVGGRLTGFGGAIGDLPHHADRFTVWNMKHQGGPSFNNYYYDFWPADAANTQRTDNIMNNPIIVGISGDTGISGNTEHMLAVESWGMPVLPVSLYESQLRMRGVSPPWNSRRRRQIPNLDVSGPEMMMVDGGFSDWSEWTPCTGGCGLNNGTRSHSRECNNPYPINGGRMCDGDFVETEMCTAFPTCENHVDGQWSEWGPWSTCNGPCGVTAGEQTRLRKCDNPSPAGGGADCEGLAVESQACTTQMCALCECTDWVQTGSCGQLEGGLVEFTRSCFTMEPQVLRPQNLSSCIIREGDHAVLGPCSPISAEKHVYLDISYESPRGHVSGNNLLRFGELCGSTGSLLEPNTPLQLVPCTEASNGPDMYFQHTPEGHLIPALMDSSYCLDVCESCGNAIVLNPCESATNAVFEFEKETRLFRSGNVLPGCEGYDTSKTVLSASCIPVLSSISL